MRIVFHSFLLYPVSAVLADGHSTGQASTNFKIRKKKEKGGVVLPFLRKDSLCTY